MNNRDVDYFDQFEEPEVEYQPHTTDDPDIWGLFDVARGRTTNVPRTIYTISGDNASKPVGILFEDGRFIPIPSTRVGTTLVVQDGGADDGQMLPKGRVLPFSKYVVNIMLPTSFELEVVWDGAADSPDILVIDDGEPILTSEHSRGLILGDYSRKAPQATKLGRLSGANEERPQGGHEFPTWVPRAA